MNLKTSLSLALGPGSAKSGVRHWWQQRLTAVALVPLAIWFLVSLLSLNATDYESVTYWISNPLNTVLLIIFVAVLIFHSKLGVQVVIEDYVHGHAVKVASLVLSRFVHYAALIAGVYAVIHVALGD